MGQDQQSPTTTECRFPFTKASNDGVGGHGVHLTTAGNLALMKALRKAYYKLKPGRSPEYVAFLARLLCPDVDARYDAPGALMDPWILAGEADGGAAIQAELDAMDPSAIAAPPDGYRQEDWMEFVKGVMAQTSGGGGDEPAMQEDGDGSEEDMF